MVWFRVDDSLPDHPKVLELQERKGWQGALALWTLAGAWCGKHLTDGKVPRAMVQRLGATARDAQALVDVGLWEDADGGYLFHDWESRNPLRAAVEKERERTRKRVEKHRLGDGGNGVTNGEANAVSTDAPARASSRPVPSRPVPTEDVQSDDRGDEPAEQPPERELPIDHHTVGREWQVAYASAGHTLSHGSDQWRGDFTLIASAIRANVPDGHRHTASRALCRWFWLAPDGPIRGERIIPGYAFPSVLAKRVDADLERARLWWNQQRQAAQEAAQ